MATITKRGDTYRIRCSLGYDSPGEAGDPLTTWKPAPGSGPRRRRRPLNRFGVLFEEKCKSGGGVPLEPAVPRRGLFGGSTLLFQGIQMLIYATPACRRAFPAWFYRVSTASEASGFPNSGHRTRSSARPWPPLFGIIISLSSCQPRLASPS